MKFVARVLLFPVVLLSAFLVLMLKWTLNLSAFVLALPMKAQKNVEMFFAEEKDTAEKEPTR